MAKKNTVLNIRLSDKQKEFLQKQADQEQKSMTEIIEKALNYTYPVDVDKKDILRELNKMLECPEELSVRDWLRFRNLLSQILYKEETGNAGIVIKYEEDPFNL